MRRRRAPRRAVEATAGDSAYPVCPDCGHHTSAWMGGGCTVWENLREARAAGWDQRGPEAMVQTYVIVGTHIEAEAARAH